MLKNLAKEMENLRDIAGNAEEEECAYTFMYANSLPVLMGMKKKYTYSCLLLLG